MPQVGSTAVDFDDLLQRTSRTFGLTIPYLPEPTRREVTLAYLLLRAADTLEDATNWTRAHRAETLTALGNRLLDPPESLADLVTEWNMNPPVEDDACRDLLAVLPEILTAIRALDPAATRIVLRHARRTIEGMARAVVAPPPADLTELGEYCYIVAGIVGELLTELFLLRMSPAPAMVQVLRDHAAAFGEGLQLVNIVRDAATDEREGRCFLPPSSIPAAIQRAHDDLTRAERYVAALADGGADPGIVMFTALPAALARATLDCVRQRGAGAKLSRADVFALCLQLEGQHGWASA